MLPHEDGESTFRSHLGEQRLIDLSCHSESAVSGRSSEEPSVQNSERVQLQQTRAKHFNGLTTSSRSVCSPAYLP
jgi:hypothetical protein